MKPSEAPAPIRVAWKSSADFSDALIGVGLLGAEEAAVVMRSLGAQPDTKRVAIELVRRNLLTRFQATPALEGRLQDLVYGEYLILDKLGSGGMGDVFRALHRRMGREVALKVLPLAAATSPDAVARFHREMKAAAKLVHPNIVTAFDAGEAHGRLFLAMELVEGRTLANLVRKEGPLAPHAAIDLVQQAAQALGYAHDKGIIHRDVSPNNLLVDGEGRVKLLDLGLARFDEAAVSPKKARGPVMGTLDYMAPEQAEDTQRADERSDIYSLGCTLFALLIGKPLFREATPAQTIAAHRSNPIPRLTELRSDVPASVDAIVRRMVAKRPEDRYPSMREVGVALAECRAALGSIRPALRSSSPPRPDRSDSGELMATSTSGSSVASQPTKEIPVSNASSAAPPKRPPPLPPALPVAPTATAAKNWILLASGLCVVMLLFVMLAVAAATGYWLLSRQHPMQTAARRPATSSVLNSTHMQTTAPAVAAEQSPPVDTPPATDLTTRPGDLSTEPPETEDQQPTATDDSSTAPPPAIESLITLEFQRDGRTVTTSYDQLTDAEWRLAEMVHDIFEAQGRAGDDEPLTIRGFHAEVQTNESVRAFTDPSRAYAYLLQLRTIAGLPQPTPGQEDFSDLVVAAERPAPADITTTTPAIADTPAPIEETPVEPEAPRLAGSDKFLCTVRSTGLKSPVDEKTFDAAERRLMLFQRAFELQYDDARSARLAEGFEADVDVAGVRHHFTDPSLAVQFVRDLKAAKRRGDDLASVVPSDYVDDGAAAADPAPVDVEISQVAQNYMAARINQEANAFFVRARRAPTEVEMQLLRQQIFQEAQIRGLISRDAIFPF